MKTNKLVIAVAAILLSTTAISYAAGTNATGTTSTTTTAGGATVAVGANGSAGASTTGATNSSGASGTQAGSNGSETVGNFSTALGESGKVDLSKIIDQAQVKIFKMSELQGASGVATSEELNNALTAQATSGDLSAKIAANSTIQTKVQAAGYSTKDVVAVWSEADGSLAVFIDDRAM